MSRDQPGKTGPKTELGVGADTQLSRKKAATGAGFGSVEPLANAPQHH